MFISKQFLMSNPTKQSISNLPVGALVKTLYNGSDLVFRIADKNHSGYPANSVTLITESIQNLNPFDAKESTNPDSNIQTYGNNRYKYSNILQWLNKSGYPWYVAQHSYDATPNSANVDENNPYDTASGFLTGFSSTFLSYLLNTSQITAKNIAIDGGGSETITSKFYLASNTEVGISNENNIAEGNKLSVFVNSSYRISYYQGSPYNWFLRTPLTSTSYCTYRIDKSGDASNYVDTGYYTGIRPLCNIINTAQVSISKDNYNTYTIL